MPGLQLLAVVPHAIPLGQRCNGIETHCRNIVRFFRRRNPIGLWSSLRFLSVLLHGVLLIHTVPEQLEFHTKRIGIALERCFCNPVHSGKRKWVQRCQFAGCNDNPSLRLQ